MLLLELMLPPVAAADEYPVAGRDSVRYPGTPSSVRRPCNDKKSVILKHRNMAPGPVTVRKMSLAPVGHPFRELLHGVTSVRRSPGCDKDCSREGFRNYPFTATYPPGRSPDPEQKGQV